MSIRSNWGAGKSPTRPGNQTAQKTGTAGADAHGEGGGIGTHESSPEIVRASDNCATPSHFEGPKLARR